MKIFRIVFLFIISVFAAAAQQNNSSVIFNAGENGIIPAWLIAGPFEYPLVGFGVSKDTAVIGEPEISPEEGDVTASVIYPEEKNAWQVQSANPEGYLNFNEVLSWKTDKNIPIKIWYSRGAYAFTKIVSDSEKEVLLLTGSNSHIKIFLNNEKVYSTDAPRNAVKDQDTVKIRLRKGENSLLIGVLNTHHNQGLAFFGTTKWEWGFFARIVNPDGSTAEDLKYVINSKNKSGFDITSTIYFRKSGNQLQQRIDVEINSSQKKFTSAILKLNAENNQHTFEIDSIPFGMSRYSFYIPEIQKSAEASAELKIGNEVFAKTVKLEKRKKYKLHIMLLNHTDVGYTHPQPVVEELHCNTLDEVIKMCKEEPGFRWTIETTWQIESYEKLRSPEKFAELIKFIKDGRIAVSPVYTNPFTGMISEEEMIRSLDLAIEYKKRFGIEYSGAVYNDVPGQAWFLPQVLNKAGVRFIAEGINEFYSDYNLQKSLPKIFRWEAADGSSLVTYINEAYTEGKTYGLESDDLTAIEQLTWERINKLEMKGYQPDLILINTSFTDNSILAAHQYRTALKWNAEYEYPKFISSNVNLFADEIIKSDYYKDLPVLKGDWTSNWDIFYQGEFERNKRTRRTQYNLLSAEKLSTLSSLLDNTKRPMNLELKDSYRSMLQFTGHGSGLEYGYGSPEENKVTMDFRQIYVDNAWLGAHSVLQKSIYRLSKPEESFDSEGLYVFNTLSWERNDLVEIHYPFDSSPRYEVIDAVTNQVIPSFRKDHRQYFVAEKVPSFGFRKFLLRPETTAAAKLSDLKKGESFIENSYYKIIYDPGTSSVSSIIDKKTNYEIINQNSQFLFSAPASEQFQLKNNYSTIKPGETKFRIIDESPVRMILSIEYSGNVIESAEFSLTEGSDKIFIRTTVNLERMEAGQTLTEYGTPFAFNVPDGKIMTEILGGFIDPDKDRLPGIDHDGYSIRGSAVVYNNERNIIWSSADARVLKIRKDSLTGEPVLISNIVNDFPLNWNRHENLEGKIDFSFSISSNEGSFNPSSAARQGFELNTPLQVRKSWYRAAPSSEEFLIIDNPDVMLLNLKHSDEGVIVRLLNSDSRNGQQASVKSRFFKGARASLINLYGKETESLPVNGETIEVKLKPGQFSDILIK